MTTTSVFVRDRFTWLAYLMLGYYAYMQASLGPLIPFLRDELQMNFTVSGLHLTAFAFGMVISGSVGDRVTGRIGRYTAFWGGGAGMAIFSILVMTGNSPVTTIAGACGMGVTGSLLLVTIQATLFDRHLEKRSYALTESNIAASVLAACAPPLIALGQTVGLTWRAVLLVGMLFWGVMWLLFRTEAMPQERKQQENIHQQSRQLPRLFWVYWLIIFLGVSVEWSTLFWGASFLELAIGLEKVTAAGLMSAFFIAMIIGRFVGSRLTRRFDTPLLLMSAVTLILIGFPIFWLARQPAVNILGLFVAALGIANLFPLTLSTVSNLFPDQSNRVSARIAGGAGAAILIAPQILGSAADQIGIANAYGVVAIFIVLIAAMIFSSYASTRQNQTSRRS